jgi:phosphatidylserine decarboxylase
VVDQGEELGFIKFGSRIDLFLPLGTELLVNLGDKVKGNISEIAAW